VNRLYVDLDGVIADFDEYALRTHNIPPSKGVYAVEDWNKLATNPRIYRDLIKTPYADDLVNQCKKFCETNNNYEMIFLTAVPKGNDVKFAFYDKVLWVLEHFRDIPVHFGPYSKDKYKHCKKNDILIDDRLSNIVEWKDAGGIAILHTNYTNTIRELYEYSSNR
jgi:5'(3')-deoxyribonucleotidase